MTNDQSRRDFLQAATATAVTVAASGKVAAAPQQSPSLVPAFVNQHQAKPLAFDASNLRGLSARLINSHWENNYGGSVNALNTVKLHLAQALDDPDTPAYVYNDLKREHLMRTGSVILHELYFDNLGGTGTPDSKIRSGIAESFGTFDLWETEFRKIGQGLGGGSGWVVLGYNQHTAQLENYWMWDHLHGPVYTSPLLVMDMYEHSYHLDYGAAAAKYIDAFFANIRWETVLERFMTAQGGADV